MCCAQPVCLVVSSLSPCCAGFCCQRLRNQAIIYKPIRTCAGVVASSEQRAAGAGNTGVACCMQCRRLGCLVMPLWRRSLGVTLQIVCGTGYKVAAKHMYEREGPPPYCHLNHPVMQLCAGAERAVLSTSRRYQHVIDADPPSPSVLQASSCLLLEQQSPTVTTAVTDCMQVQADPWPAIALQTSSGSNRQHSDAKHDNGVQLPALAERVRRCCLRQQSSACT